MWRINEMWGSTLQREKRRREQQQDDAATPLDPDSVYKMGGQQSHLEQTDAEHEQHLLYGLWLLLRTGRLG